MQGKPQLTAVNLTGKAIDNLPASLQTKMSRHTVKLGVNAEETSRLQGFRPADTHYAASCAWTVKRDVRSLTLRTRCCLNNQRPFLGDIPRFTCVHRSREKRKRATRLLRNKMMKNDPKGEKDVGHVWKRFNSNENAFKTFPSYPTAELSEVRLSAITWGLPLDP